MPPSPAATRAKPATPAMAGSFQAAFQRIAAHFAETILFQHQVSKGTEREIPIKKLFQEQLPSCYSVAQGEVIDLGGRHSPQMDVVIYDSTRNFPLYSGASIILPAEALLASIEVKSYLTPSEIRKSIAAARKLKSLRPFGKEMESLRKEGEEAKSDRFFHCLFAYESNLTGRDWLVQEYRRYRASAKKIGADENAIDCLYVLNRGLVCPAWEKGISEKPGSGNALLQFYMHVLNFVSRENGRRKPVPYLRYAKQVAQEWTKLS